MNSQDVCKYFMPAFHNLYEGFGEDDIFETSKYFHYKEALNKFDKEFLDGEYEKYALRVSSADYPISIERRELLQKLAGPHGKTIMKIIQARRKSEIA